MRTWTVGQEVIYTFPLSFLGGVMPDMDVPGVITAVKPGDPRKGEIIELKLRMPKGNWGPAAERDWVAYGNDPLLKPRAARRQLSSAHPVVDFFKTVRRDGARSGFWIFSAYDDPQYIFSSVAAVQEALSWKVLLRFGDRGVVLEGYERWDWEDPT